MSPSYWHSECASDIPVFSVPDIVGGARITDLVSVLAVLGTVSVPTFCIGYCLSAHLLFILSLSSAEAVLVPIISPCSSSIYKYR